jgi:hypothetical protein
MLHNEEVHNFVLLVRYCYDDCIMEDKVKEKEQKCM